MRDKTKEFKPGDKLLYVGKGFVGFDPENKLMIFIERVYLFDYRVKYKDFEMIVRDSEVLKFKKYKKATKL